MKQNEPSIKRYDMEISTILSYGDSDANKSVVSPVEYQYGDWVKWEDVEELIDKLRSWEIHNDSFHNDFASLSHSYYMSSPQ